MLPMPSPLEPFVELWVERVGLVDPRRAAVALAPAVKRYGGERVMEALRGYLDNPHLRVRRLEYFVQDIVRYLPPDPSVPLVDEYGDLTTVGLSLYASSRR